MSRVLFLTESFHPVLGGGETHIRRLGSALAAAGDSVTVVTRRGQRSWPAQETLDGIRVVRVAPSGPGRTGKFLMVPAALRALGREARAHDLLVVRGTRVLGLPALVAARWLGLPVVLQPEINGELSGEAFTWGKSWQRTLAGRAVLALVACRNLWLRDAEAFVAMSRLIEREMLDAGVGRSRVSLIAHGVDVDHFRPALDAAEKRALRSGLGLPAGVLATYTGRLLRGKGLRTLVEAFALVAPSSSELSLVIVGSGEGQALSVEAELRRAVEARGLATRVVFAGRSERVADWLRASDLFVFPSRYEALGISLVEAAACGLPAIGSRTGGIVDVIEDGRSGLLVPPGDVPALAAALGRLAADAALREAMGAEARRLALARFDERDALARYRALFAEISPRPGS